MLRDWLQYFMEISPGIEERGEDGDQWSGK